MYEIEVKYYDYYRSPMFVKFLKQYYKQYLSHIVEDTSYVYPNSTRVTINSDGTTSHITKERLSRKELGRNRILSVSNEIPREGDLPDLNKGQRRNRYREIYLVPGNLQLHITTINGKDFEIELEREVENVDGDEIEQFGIDFEKFTENLDHHAENFRTFIRIFNGDNATGSHFEMNRSVIARPRSINKNDFITDRGRGIPEGYTLTIKGNGVPMILYHRSYYTYLIAPFKSYILYHTSENQELEEFMILGEFFESLNMFAPFDILHWSRHKNVRHHKNHPERMDMVDDIIERNKNLFGKLRIFTKDFVEVGKTPESFAKAYNQVRNASYPFEDDGLIMTPIHTGQNPGFSKVPKISKHPEILKIKPWHEHTIDFRVDLKNKLVFTNAANGPFGGTSRYPFSSKINVDFDSIPSELDKHIIEFKPVKKEIDGNETIVMSFSRDRPDKDTPNGKIAADDEWRQLMEPIDDVVYLAKDFSRLRWQNNIVKRDLLVDNIPKNAIVVDLGGGKGGDIQKYEKSGAKVVLAVEPNKEFIEEFKARLDSIKPSTKFIILNAYGQETEKIIGNLKPILEKNSSSPIVIVSMLTLTFFWKNITELTRLENTLKAISNLSPYETKFLFYTIEGHRFKKYFSETKNNKILNYGLRAQYKPEETQYGVGIKGKVKLEVIGSKTVDKVQTEWLVDLDDLKCLSNVSYKEGLIERYLTIEELKYGRCHVYGSGIVEKSTS